MESTEFDKNSGCSCSREFYMEENSGFIGEKYKQKSKNNGWKSVLH